MFGHRHCTRCHQAIAPERQNQALVVCDSCGLVMSPMESASRKRFERQALVGVVGLAGFLVLAFMHLVSWGGFCLEVLPLQASRLLGSMSGPSAERMAEICLETKKLDCVEEMYELQAAKEPAKLVRLGKFRFNRMKYAQAAESFRQYFAAGADDADAAYVYARALGEIGKVDEASKQYEHLIAAKPRVLQVTVLQNYVKLLIQNGRYDEALKAIEGVRKRDESVSLFMNSDYEDIKQRIKKNG